MDNQIILPNNSHNMLNDSANDLKDICSPLFKATGLSCFYFTRLYYNGTGFTLGSNPDWNYYFFEKYFKQEHYPVNGGNGVDYVFLDARFPEIAKSASEFNIHKMFSIVNKTPEYYDAIVFATDQPNNKMTEYYFNYLGDLKQFAYYFYDKGSNIIKESKANMFKWRDKDDCLDLDYEFTKPYKIKDSQQLKEQITPNKYIVEIQDRIISLTKREYQCLASLSKGMTYKEIAAQHGISPKTVEAYLLNAKTKSHASSKVELVNFFEDNFV